MRKNSVRKFVHAVLSIIPLFVIPIFALNILHKETEPISIEVQENEIVNFNQLISYIPSGNYSIVDTNISITSDNTSIKYVRFSNNIDFINTHIYLMQLNITEKQGTIPNTFDIDIANSTLSFPKVTESQPYFQFTSTIDVTSFAQMQIPANTNGTIKFEFNLFDLTQMYGSGNEPSTIDFKSQFPNTYYNFTLSKEVLIEGVITTYNDTDIGSQFVYALYKPVHDYFNFNNLFNMGAIYNWIELNLFSGTAPLPIFIIWNILLYEFFIAIIYLLFSVFVFLIDFAQKCIDSFYDRSFGGMRR